MFLSNFLILSFHLKATPWWRLEAFFLDLVSNWREGCVDQVIIWRCGFMNEYVVKFACWPNLSVIMID